MAEFYAYKEDAAKVNEIIKNMELQDPDYYYTIATKAQDTEWLGSTSIAELEKYREKSKN